MMLFNTGKSPHVFCVVLQSQCYVCSICKVLGCASRVCRLSGSRCRAPRLLRAHSHTYVMIYIIQRCHKYIISSHVQRDEVPSKRFPVFCLETKCMRTFSVGIIVNKCPRICVSLQFVYLYFFSV